METLIAFKENYSAETDNAFNKWIKVALNRCYGKFASKPFEEKSTLCDNIQEFNQVLARENVLNVIPLSENLIDVISSYKTTNLRHPNTCITLGIHIFTFARQLLQEKIIEIKKTFSPSEILMVNTDAAVVAIPSTQSITLLPISNKVGHWKHQLKDSCQILRFFCLNATTYQLTYLNSEKQQIQVTKMAGFCLNNMLANSVPSKEFEDLVQKGILQEKAEIKICQFRKKKRPGDIAIETKTEFCLKSKLDGKRVSFPNYKTLAYGYPND